MNARPMEALESLGLGGDGDEVDAIETVERCFGVELDKADATGWVTVGDVFASLLRALPLHQRDRDAAWPPFCAAICEETDADPRRVGPQTLLIGLPIRVYLSRWVKRTLRRES